MVNQVSIKNGARRREKGGGRGEGEYEFSLSETHLSKNCSVQFKTNCPNIEYEMTFCAT